MSKTKPKLYLAYGSNLNIRQMKYRCPGARLYKTGTLENYILEFRGAPNHAFATITPREGGIVPVALWRITAQDEKNLDLYEGFPSHYFKETVSLNLDGGEMEAMAYRMNIKAKFGLPTQSYYQTVLEGYRNCGLDTRVLADALEASVLGYHKGQNPKEEPKQNPAENPEERDPFFFREGMKL